MRNYPHTRREEKKTQKDYNISLNQVLNLETIDILGQIILCFGELTSVL